MPVDTTTKRYTGQNMYISFAGVAINTDYKSLSMSETIDTVDITAGSETTRRHIPTISSAEMSFEVFQTDVTSTGGTAIRGVLAVGTQGTLIWGPEGTAANMPKYSCVATITQLDISYPFDGAVEMSATFMRNGDWLDNFEHSQDVFP